MRFGLFDWDLLGLGVLAVIALFAIGEGVAAVVLFLLMVVAVFIDQFHPRRRHALR